MNKDFDILKKYHRLSFNYSKNTAIKEREIHSYHEILYYIDGGATLITEGRRQELKRGSLIIIPKGLYHFLKTEKPQSFARLKISVPTEEIKELPVQNLFDALQIIEGLSPWANKIINEILNTITEQESPENEFRAYSLFLTLLSELSVTQKSSPQVKISDFDDVFISITKYISENLQENLTIDALAQKFNISPSNITHSFKKQMGISLHNYIVEKRIIFARELILKGHKPTDIFAKCGYQDYSSFYKAYVNFFGHSPSLEKKRNAK